MRIIIFSLLFFLDLQQDWHNQQNADKEIGNISSYIACSKDEVNYTAYIIQYHLVITNFQSTLIPDSSLKYDVFFVTSDRDTTFRMGLIDAGYLLGYAGHLMGPCYDDTNLYMKLIDDREFWFVLNLPVNKKHRAKSIHFKLWANIDIGGEISLREFSSITKIE